jgi:hypothetical protein
MITLTQLARDVGLPALHLIEDDREFLVMAYQLARRLENDPAISPRRRLAINDYASAALCKLADRATREARS